MASTDGNHENKEYTLGEETPNGMIIENILNREGDILPFGYYKPETEGKLKWMCNYGLDGTDIVSVFAMVMEDGKVEKNTKYLKDIDQAKYVRDELINNGWLPIKLPEIKFKMSSDGLNRKQRRELEKQMKKK